MKYIEEFKRALKIAGFMAAGVFLGAGLLPWVMADDKSLATPKLIGTIWGVVGAFAAAVAFMFVNEIMRTKRLAKKAGKKK